MRKRSQSISEEVKNIQCNKIEIEARNEGMFDRVKFLKVSRLLMISLGVIHCLKIAGVVSGHDWHLSRDLHVMDVANNTNIA